MLGTGTRSATSRTLGFVDPAALTEAYAHAVMAAAVIALFIGAFAWFGDRRAEGRSFAHVELLICVWSFLKYFQTRGLGAEHQLFLVRLQYIIIPSLPVLAFSFGRAIDGKPRLSGSPRLLALLLIVPGITCLLAFFSGSIPLLWRDEGLSGWPLINPRAGPWFFVHLVYSYVLILYALIALVRRTRRTKGVARDWFAVITGCLAFPVAVNVLFLIFSPNSNGLDLTLLAFALSGFLIALALSRFNLFDTVPYAKDIILAAFATPLISVDREGRVLGANAAAERLFGDWRPLEGRRLEELCGLRAESFPDGLPVELDFLDRVFMVNAHHVRGFGWKLRGSIVSFAEVTERAAAIRALEKSEESLRRYEFMVNASRDPMCIVDREYRYEAVNDAYIALFGLSREELIGRSVLELWREEALRLDIAGALGACFQGKLIVTHWEMPADAAGVVRHFESTYNPYRSASGELSHAVIVMKDVSEYIETQQVLGEARERAEEANRAKSAFFATVSHEIRTPLTAIIGLAELSLRGHPPPGLREDLATILAAGKNLLAIINDILDLSKIEAGRISFEVLDFDLVPTIEGILKTLRPTASEKGLTLECEVGPGLPGIVRGDPLRLGQILINLVGNAIKFTDRGGVTVRLESEPLPRNGSFSFGLRALVRDTGIGIAKDKQCLVFESFSQADSSTSRRFGGTGLGLAICKRLCDLFGGSIWVESELGKGSVFGFTAFFYAPEESGNEYPLPPAEASPASPSRGGGRSLSVLVVEDNPVNAQVVFRWLASEGHEVSRASSGEAALTLLAEQSFDVVLMDLEIPGMDGLETTRRIRGGTAGEKSRRIPIIAMTAHVDPERRGDAKAAGMDGYISKPIDFVQLEALISRFGYGDELARGSETAAMPIGPGPSGPGRLLEPEGPLARLDEDRELYGELLSIFVTEAPKRRAELEATIRQCEREPLRRIAHAIRGNARTIGAMSLADAAETMEGLAASPEAEEGGTSLQEASAEVARLLGETASAIVEYLHYS